MNSLFEIVQAQELLNQVDIKQSIDDIIQQAKNKKRVTRRDFKKIFFYIINNIEKFEFLSNKNFMSLYHQTLEMFVENDRIFLKNYVDIKKFLISIEQLQTNFYLNIFKDIEVFSSTPIVVYDKKNNFLKNLLIEKNKFKSYINLNLDSNLNYLVYKKNYLAIIDSLVESTNQIIGSETEKTINEINSLLKNLVETIIDEFDEILFSVSKKITKVSEDFETSTVHTVNEFEKIMLNYNEKINKITVDIDNFLKLTVIDANNKIKKTLEEYNEKIINSSNELKITHNTIIDNFNSQYQREILNDRKYSQAERITYSKKRLILQLEKKSAENLIKNNNLYEKLSILADLVKECNDYLEVQKKSKTAQLIKERSRLGLDPTWPTEKSYLNSMLKWKNDYTVEQFVGLAGQYVDWKYPIAYFDPNIAELLRYLVSGDPFYIVDDIKLPYKRLIQKLPEESHKKIYHYNKKDADTYLEKNSVGLCVSWNNFPFYTQGKIYSDLQLMSKILRPGGYAIFNYVNSHTVAGAKFVENHEVSIVWKERMDRYANEHDLISIKDCEYVNYPFTISVYQKKGSMPSLNLINKLGLVLRKK